MEYLHEVLPVILYILGSILLVALIVLTIKMIKTLNKVDQVVEDIDNKSKKLNGVFDMVDAATDTLSILSDKMVNLVVSGIANLFNRKSKKEDVHEQE